MSLLARALGRARRTVPEGVTSRRTLAAFLAVSLIVALGAVRPDLPIGALKSLGVTRDSPMLRSSPLAALQLTLPSRAAEEVGHTTSWISLVERPWAYATTGWLVLADQDQPVLNTSFVDGPMAIGGMVYSDGIGTYPFSEVAYPLDRHGLRFTTAAGITDDSKNGAGTVRFTVYGDEFILWASDLVRAGQPARDVDISVEGISQLRLVVDDGGDGSLGDYALWAQPRLLLTDGEPSAVALHAIERARAEHQQQESEHRAIEHRLLEARLEPERATLAEMDAAGPATQGAFYEPAGLLVLGNHRVIATLGFGGSRNGFLSMFRRGEDAPLIVDASPTVVTSAGATLRLADLQPGRNVGHTLRPVSDATLGSGIELRAPYRTADATTTITVALTVYDDDPSLTVAITSEGAKLGAVDYFGSTGGGSAGSAILLGDDVRYLSDRSHFYRGNIEPDGHTRRAALEATKPALIWSDRSERGLLFALYDYVPSPTWLTMRRDPGVEAINLGIELVAQLDDFGPESSAPPPLTIQVVEGPVGAATFERFRRVVQARYPDGPWPGEMKYQWGSWYAFGPGITERLLLTQLDLMTSMFGDLGRWHMVIDAGWHLQYGSEEAELGVVDWEKFPQGVRGISEEAHRRGIDVVLYLGTGFVHDSPADGGEWLALRGLIERHPEWMIPFQPDGSHVNRYLLDYRNPEAQAYVRAVIRDFYLVHGVDGILLDGLADAEGQLIPRPERDRPEGPPHPLLPTLDIYRMVWDESIKHHPEPFIESGWLNPTAANPYAQIFRYADEVDKISSPYPFGGFLERLDYAIFSRQALGQRTNVGTAHGDPARPDMRWWVQAAAALGSNTTLSFDLRTLDPVHAAGLRADLIAMEPFQGTTRFGPGLFPDTFATTRDGVTYLGVLNREPSPREIHVALGPLGLAGRSYAALDVQTERPRTIDADFAVAMPARSFRLFVLRPNGGVLWTASSLEMDPPRPDGLALVARGPADVPGSTYIATPPPTAVLMDGRALQPTAAAPQDGQYSYDEAAGVLTLRYSHGAGRRIEVRR